jgi:dihydrofolate reductase
VSGNASGGGELLFGRKTYQMMAAFWPTPAAAQQMPAVAEGMNATRKYVASKTIQPTWNNTHLLEGNLIDAVRALKAGDGPGITLLGSGSIAAQLGEAGLVDEYQFVIVIVPVALGAGRTVFVYRRITRQTARGFLPGTHALLDRLEAQLEGRPLPDWLQLMRDLQTQYPEWSGHAPSPTE